MLIRVSTQLRPLAFLSVVLLAFSSATHADDLTSTVSKFVRARCIHCHDSETTTRFNFDQLAFDVSTYEHRLKWAEVYDQLISGTMPPKSEQQPSKAELDKVTQALHAELSSATRATQLRLGRVPARRLTRTEFEYSLLDLLAIDGEFANLLPEETRSGSFDTVARNQHFSAQHIESYLKAADAALDTAIRLHKSPFRSYDFDLRGNEHLNSFHERELRLGGNISRKLDDGVAVFRDVDYLLRSDLHGFRIRSTGSGYYRIRITASAFQASQPVTMKVIVKDIDGQSKLVGACDVVDGKARTYEVDAWLTRTKVFYVGLMEDRPAAQILADIYDDGGAEKYTGPGLKINSIHVEGPITGGWPPKSTRRLLGEATLISTDDGVYDVKIKQPAETYVANVTNKFAAQALRRPLENQETTDFLATADSAIANNEELADVLREPLKTILTSPQFVIHSGKPGPLDGHSLASRLSYFLWKSVPDQQLLDLARSNQLNDPKLLAAQLDRMLDDERSTRFVKDFVGQWLRLNEINSTTPDEKLYPEYDELLHWSIPQETEKFFNELVQNDLPLLNLIDSDFTFLNRRLATHYGIDGVEGQHFRRVDLPKDSPRGGVLSQASILKVTSNGLVTSPVKRGDFVLSELLGTPPAPPPNNVGSIEPNVSSATTVRELLEKHRDVETCSKCHQLIDPPGFALESFDPIGGFRTHYRISCDDFLTFVAHTDGAPVDASGETVDGHSFSNVQEFKQYLMQSEEQLARHFASQLIIYSTGGEIEFSDRAVVDDILNRGREQGFPVRKLIHEVVQSRLFRER